MSEGLFIVDLLAETISAEEKKILASPNVGGVLLFSRNAKSMGQLKQLTEDIRDIRSDVFIAVDHEGGVVQRFKFSGFSPLPAFEIYGELYDLDPNIGCVFARKKGQQMAEQLLECGIDLSLTPVLDLNDKNSEIIGQLGRSFHHDPTVLTRLAHAFMEGMASAGMPTVGKHFPGHGRVLGDSHWMKPTIDDTYAELKDKDLKPFIDLIQQHKLSAIMPAHVTYTAIDPDAPAGFSSIWLQQILRETLGFDGLVMSDCLSMKGAEMGSMSLRIEKALAAGCDMLILCNQDRLFLQAVLEIDYPQTEAGLRRIHQFKKILTPHVVRC